LFILLSLLTTSSLYAQAPRLLNYQGKLNAAATDTFRMTFTIYSDSTGSAILWKERHEKINIAAGVFNVLLGSINPFPANLFTTAGDRYLGIAVGNDVEMKPRWRFTSVPFALSASRADTVKSGNDKVDKDWVVSGNNMHAAVTGNAGIGTATPSEKLVVGDDLGSALPGNRVTIGNRDSHSVINLGEDLDNRALVGWIDGNDFLPLTTRRAIMNKIWCSRMAKPALAP
jgi:hypothetical protein